MSPARTPHYSHDKGINDCVRDYVQAGWTVQHGKKHRKLTAPNGRFVSIPGTPGDLRARKNFLADVRRLAAQQPTTTDPS